MSRIRIVKKNDEYTSEYQVGDLFEITGTWYGGVHIMGKSGAPVSLDKEEYVELDTEPELKQEEVIPRDIRVGDIVQHFKREWVSGETSEYLYKVLAFAQHTETGDGYYGQYGRDPHHNRHIHLFLIFIPIPGKEYNKPNLHEFGRLYPADTRNVDPPCGSACRVTHHQHRT